MNRADAAGARADLRHAENEIAYKVKEVFYGILATGRRRDSVDAQIRAAELRITETRNAVETGVALEVKATEVRTQIAQARHVHGQLQDAVMDMKLELADLCGLPVDTALELVHRVVLLQTLRRKLKPRLPRPSHKIPKSRRRVINSRRRARRCGGSRRIHT